MKPTQSFLTILSALAIVCVVISCEMPMDLDFSGFSDFEIIPSGNPTWPDGGGGGWYPPPPDFILYGAAADEKTVVAIGTDVARLNEDGTWSREPAPSGHRYNDIIWCDTTFLAVGTWTSAAFSDDGISWRVTEQTNNDILTSVAYSGQHVVATGHSYSSLGYRAIFVMNADGSFDTIDPDDSIAMLKKVLWVDSRFVAFGSAVVAGGWELAVITSVDGVNWTRLQVPPHCTFDDIIWCDNYYLAASGKTLYRSADAIQWTMVTTLSGSIKRLYFNKSALLAVGNLGHISMSSDGIAWNLAETPVTDNLFAAEHCGGKYYAFGTETILSSPDGVTWEECAIR